MKLSIIKNAEVKRTGWMLFAAVIALQFVIVICAFLSNI